VLSLVSCESVQALVGTPRKWLTPLGCLILAAVTFLVFWPVTDNGFINYDDQDYVTTNLRVQQGLTWDAVSWAFRTTYSANWHPLTWISHMLDCQWFGLNPAGHHFTNLLLHAANTVLVFLLLFQLTRAVGRSAFVAALFALHPLHVESVAWVAERKDVLSAFFGLLCLMEYPRYAGARALACSRPEPPPAKEAEEPAASFPASCRLKPALHYILALLLFALGLMCKPMLVTIPLLMLLLDYWPLERWTKRRVGLIQILLEKCPFVLLTFISSLVTLQVQSLAMGYYDHLSFAERAANAFIAYLRYLGKTFWPHNLAVLYPHPGHWPPAYVFGAVLLLIAVTVVVCLNRERRPYLFVGWFWFIVSLFPVLGLVQVGVQSMADRYTYLPLIGIFVMFAWGGAEALCELSKRAPAHSPVGSSRLGGFLLALGCGIALVAVLCCAVLTRAQLVFWRNTECIFTRAIAVTEGNWVAHYNLALLFLERYQQGRRTGLENQLAQSGMSPEAVGAHGNDLDQVILHCQAAMTANPRFADAYITLAKALTEQGDLPAARARLEQALQLDPHNPDARANLAEIFLRQGEPAKAVVEYRKALEFKPDWDSVLNNLGWLLATRKEPTIRNGPEAVCLAEHACTLTHRTNLWYLHTLAAAYAEAGDFTNAVATAALACQVAQTAGSNLEQTATARLQLYKTGQVLRE